MLLCAPPLPAAAFVTLTPVVLELDKPKIAAVIAEERIAYSSCEEPKVLSFAILVVFVGRTPVVSTTSANVK
jgi:hypothetical protein